MTQETEHEKRQDINRRDHNHEFGGQNVGRIKRFLSEEGRAYIESKQNGKPRDRLGV